MKTGPMADRNQDGGETSGDTPSALLTMSSKENNVYANTRSLPCSSKYSDLVVRIGTKASQHLNLRVKREFIIQYMIR